MIELAKAQTSIHGSAATTVERLNPDAVRPRLAGAFDCTTAITAKIAAQMPNEIKPNSSPARRLPLLRKSDPRSLRINLVSTMMINTTGIHCDNLSIVNSSAVLPASGSQFFSQLPSVQLSQLANAPMKSAKATGQ